MPGKNARAWAAEPDSRVSRLKRIIELAGDCLHLIVGQALSVREHRELIAGERLFSKDGDQREFIRLHQGAPFNSIRFPSGSFK